MGQVGAKLRSYGTSGTSRGFAHWCPACREVHVFITERNVPAPPMWTFNGDTAAPTFSPSMKITGKEIERDAEGKWTGEWVRDPSTGQARDFCCHYILTAGVLNYCGDSTHAMKGQSVPLPDLPPHLKD